MVFLALFFIYGIVGLQIFSGPEMHAVCRLTPFPVFANWTAGTDPTMYRCLNVPNYDTLGSSTRLVNAVQNDFLFITAYHVADRYCSFITAY